MPIFRSGTGNAPAWCEMQNFEIIDLKAGEEKLCVGATPRELFICVEGKVQLSDSSNQIILEPGGGHGADQQGDTNLTAIEDSRLFRAMGHWESISGSGIFTSQTAEPPTTDTPYTYEKTTSFDNHYHDCDEYWIILEGQATVCSEGKLYDVGPGDNVVTGMGWHHDVVSCKSKEGIRAIYVEGTLEGRKRLGHLWEPEHGPAQPCKDRI